MLEFHLMNFLRFSYNIRSNCDSNYNTPLQRSGRYAYCL